MCPVVESGRNPEGLCTAYLFENAGVIVEIQIQKESSECIRCSQAFAHEQKHFSLLKIEDNTFLREDYCEKCWGERSDPTRNAHVYSYWETKYRDPAVEKALPKEQFIPLLNLCYESIALDGPDADAMAYMCALILRRQKIFRFIREEKNESSGKSELVFADKYNDTQIRITDPQLTEAQLEEVKHTLEERLGNVRGHTNDE
jgi:hypothetical protein